MFLDERALPSGAAIGAGSAAYERSHVVRTHAGLVCLVTSQSTLWINTTVSLSLSISQIACGFVTETSRTRD